MEETKMTKLEKKITRNLNEYEVALNAYCEEWDEREITLDPTKKVKSALAEAEGILIMFTNCKNRLLKDLINEPSNLVEIAKMILQQENRLFDIATKGLK